MSDERRADLIGADKAVSEVLDEINVRRHGLFSGGSYHREFREWLSDRGYVVGRPAQATTGGKVLKPEGWKPADVAGVLAGNEPVPAPPTPAAPGVAELLAELVEHAHKERRAAWDADNDEQARFWSAAAGWIRSVQRSRPATGTQEAPDTLPPRPWEVRDSRVLDANGVELFLVHNVERWEQDLTARWIVHVVNGAAPGVAALLAECERKERSRVRVKGGYLPAIMTADEIRRLLAPSGADGTEAGT